MVCTICALINPVVKQHTRCTLPLTNKKKPSECWWGTANQHTGEGVRSLNKQVFVSSFLLCHSNDFIPASNFSRVFSNDHTRFYFHWQCSANKNPRVKLTSRVFETRSFFKGNVLHNVYIFHKHIPYTLV